MQNLRRVGKIAGPVLSRLWTKVHELLRQFGRLS